MKRLLLGWLIFCIVGVSIPTQMQLVCAEEETDVGSLYAQSAVLMDGDSGRILYEKNGFEAKPMASTTKIMTCITALENGTLADTVTASEYAASRPKVHLGMDAGEEFRLEDLLYSLMLESHNDSAAAIAEHIGGSVEGFASMMNQKAKELGCESTYFITPNGLDASDENGVHSTTAADLARIMRYCIMESEKKEEFLTITRTKNYSFSDVAKERMFSCNNHNAFLNMMDGALSGKTGFTGDAGYCYVGALERDGKTFIVALLACGWPNNKSYKWSDTRKLMDYGLANYEYKDVFETEKTFQPVTVTKGIPKEYDLSIPAKTDLRYECSKEQQKLEVLLRKDEQVAVEYETPDEIAAPVKKGKRIGSARYFLNGEMIREYPLVVQESVQKITFLWCLRKMARQYLNVDVMKALNG